MVGPNKQDVDLPNRAVSDTVPAAREAEAKRVARAKVAAIAL